MTQQGIWIAAILLIILLGVGGAIMYSQHGKDRYVEDMGYTPTSVLVNEGPDDHMEAVADDIQLINNGDLAEQPNMGMGPQAMGSSRVTNGGW